MPTRPLAPRPPHLRLVRARRREHPCFLCREERDAARVVAAAHERDAAERRVRLEAGAAVAAVALQPERDGGTLGGVRGGADGGEKRAVLAAGAQTRDVLDVPLRRAYDGCDGDGAGVGGVGGVGVGVAGGEGVCGLCGRRQVDVHDSRRVGADDALRRANRPAHRDRDAADADLVDEMQRGRTSARV
eukprot:5749254-Pleurochrysis_carterae.AAC.9